MKVIREQTETLVMEYAAGALDEACSLLVASYITLCPDARHYLQRCEMMGGALMEHGCHPVAMDKSSLQNVLERLDEENSPPQAPAQSRFCRENNFPAPVRCHIDGNSGSTRWRYGLSRTIKYCPLPVADSRYKVTLMKMLPGARMARHGHTGTELTLILEGGYQDEFGSYKAGDLVIADENIMHQPVAGEQGCMCLTALELPRRITRRWHIVVDFFSR